MTDLHRTSGELEPVQLLQRPLGVLRVMELGGGGGERREGAGVTSQLWLLSNDDGDDDDLGFMAQQRVF